MIKFKYLTNGQITLKSAGSRKSQKLNGDELFQYLD